jgi:hypothetical protein
MGDLGLAHRLAQKAVQRFLAARRAERRTVLIVDSRQVHLPARMAQLHDEFGIEAMDRLSEPGPKRDEIVAVDRGVTRNDAALHQHRHVGGNDRADAALGKLAFPVDAGLGERSILIVETA